MFFEHGGLTGVWQMQTCSCLVTYFRVPWSHPWWSKRHPWWSKKDLCCKCPRGSTHVVLMRMSDGAHMVVKRTLNILRLLLSSRATGTTGGSTHVREGPPMSDTYCGVSPCSLLPHPDLKGPQGPRTIHKSRRVHSRRTRAVCMSPYSLPPHPDLQGPPAPRTTRVREGPPTSDTDCGVSPCSLLPHPEL